MSIDHEPAPADDVDADGAAATTTSTTTGAQPEATPRQPVAWHPASRFRSQPMVKWLSLKEGLRGGQGEFFGGLFSAFADNRESQAALRDATVHRPLEEREARFDGRLTVDPLPFHANGAADSLWFDYVADIGDGFSPTYLIAREMAREELVVQDGEDKFPVPRGSMIVMGGDEVYPVAGDRHYRERTIGPYRAAFADVADDDRVPLFAIPGNHDWYDGLAAFLKQFTVLRPNGREGPRPSPGARWTTHQTRSYFATQLTDTWWLWGVDIALDAHIDSPQIQYFRDVAETMPGDARIILCTAKPAWLTRKATPDKRRRTPKPPSSTQRAESGDATPAATSSPPGWARSAIERFRNRAVRDTPEPDAWDQYRYFIKETLGGPIDALNRPEVRLVLSGDKHFYARHEPTGPTRTGREPMLVTSGGGGAYLSSTYGTAADLDLPTHWFSEGAVRYSRARAWPRPADSKRIGLTGLWKLPLRNVGLAMILGLFYVMLGLSAWAQRASEAALRNSERLDLAGRLPNADRVGDEFAELVGRLSLKTYVDPTAFSSLGSDGLGTAFSAMGRSSTAIVVLVLMGLAFFGLAKAGKANPVKAALLAAVHLGVHLVAAAVTVATAAWIANTGNWGLALVVPISVTVLALAETSRQYRRDHSTNWRPAAIAVVATLILVLIEVALIRLEPSMYRYVVALFGIGSVLGMVAFTLYLVGAQFTHTNLNELFVGLRHEGYKQFLRIRVDGDGVEVFSIGYRNVAQRHVAWKDGIPVVTTPPATSKSIAVGHELVDRFRVEP